MTYGCEGPLELHNSIRYTHRLLSSSLLGLPYRILNINHTKELFRSLWVVCVLSDLPCLARALKPSQESAFKQFPDRNCQ